MTSTLCFPSFLSNRLAASPCEYGVMEQANIAQSRFTWSEIQSMAEMSLDSDKLNYES